MTRHGSDHVGNCQNEALARAEVDRRFVELGGRRLSYLAAGDSAPPPAIVLIHGSAVSAGYWIHQLRGLRNTSQVVALDLPGHGKSDPIRTPTVDAYAEAVAMFLDVLGIGPAIVVGHSLGGAVAIALTAGRPDMVIGLVLLSSCAKLPQVDGPWARLLPYLPGPLRKLLFFSMAQKLLFAPGVPRGAVSLGLHELQSCRPETILSDLHAAKTMDLSQAATQLDVPTLVMCGSRDKLTPPALSERLRALIPRSRLSLVEGAGHMLLLEVPTRVNQEILDFAASLGVKATTPLSEVAHGRRGGRLLRRLLDWARGRLRSDLRRCRGWRSQR